MNSPQKDYWRDVIESSLDMVAITLTPEQLDSVAGDLVAAAENMLEAMEERNEWRW